MTPEDLKEAIEHRGILNDVRAILTTVSGRSFFKYLFKYFDVGGVPEVGLEGNILHGLLGHLRAGNSIFQLAAEADPIQTATLLAQIKKEYYAALHADAQTGQD